MGLHCVAEAYVRCLAAESEASKAVEESALRLAEEMSRRGLSRVRHGETIITLGGFGVFAERCASIPRTEEVDSAVPPAEVNAIGSVPRSASGSIEETVAAWTLPDDDEEAEGRALASRGEASPR